MKGYDWMEKMSNPWEEISLSDYENHMSLDSVKQLQTLNGIMKEQLNDYNIDSAMVLGIAGGNGLEHVDVQKYQKVYGIDINEEYLNTVRERFRSIDGKLECLKINLIEETNKLPHAKLVIANLLIEYIGYEAFQRSMMQVKPLYVSCVIQINTDENAWVSDSPYLHAFDGLDAVHYQMEENALSEAMKKIGYECVKRASYPLPNGKDLMRLDYISLEVMGK